MQTTALWQKENEHVGVIKNLAHIGLEKKKRTLLIQLKIPEQKKNERLAFFFFFGQIVPAGSSLLFILASDSFFGSKLIWVVIPTVGLLSGLKG